MTEVDLEPFYAYAYAQYGGGNLTEAADLFRLLCTRRPLEARFWFGLGATLQETGSYGDALHAWAMAALLRGEDPYPHFHAAECYLSLNERTEAIKALAEAAIRAQNEHPLSGKISVLKKQWEV